MPVMKKATAQGSARLVSWQDRLRVVLVRPRNPLNIGAAARAMLNFGFAELWLVEPYNKAFREARSAVGAAGVLEQARVTSDLASALGDASLVVATSAMRGRADDQVQRMLPEGAHPLRTHLEDRNAALVFGSEKFGLSNDDLSHCDWTLTIPTGQACPSMNLGQAVALCCYEIARHSKAVPRLKTPATAGADERDRMTQMLLPMLEAGGFILPESRDSQMRKLRRWVGRLRLAPQDARVFQGMLRQIQWKLDNP
jgi:tRNA/rRNA methyltransferase